MGSHAIFDVCWQAKGDRWDGMYIDMCPGDEVKPGTVIKAEIELHQSGYEVHCSENECSVYMLLLWIYVGCKFSSEYTMYTDHDEQPHCFFTDRHTRY